MGMRGLGRVYDLAPVFLPVDMSAGANSGLLVSFENCSDIDFVLYKDPGTAGDDPVITVREAQDASGTNEQDLDVVTAYHYKGDASVSGNETWTAATQTAGDIDTDGTLDAEEGGFVVFHVSDADLSDGYTHVTFDVADTGTNAGALGGAFAILHGLNVQRAPENLAAPQ